MTLAVATEGERIFQPGIVLVKYGKSGHHYMSGIYTIGLFVMAIQTGCSGQIFVFFHTHSDNSTCQYNLYEL